MLRRQDVVVDGKNGVAYFSRRQLPASPVQHNRLGAVFTRSDLEQDALEAHVAPGSPAELAGIRSGDMLLKIDTLDVTKWRTDPSMRSSQFWQRPAGTKFDLTLKHADVEITVTVTLRDILGPDVALETPAPRA
jgi:C-terminal processing protease CtpA/Prc